MWRRLVPAALALLWALAAVPVPAAAHSVPGGSLAGIPRPLYLGAGAAVVVLSFLFAGAFVGGEGRPAPSPIRTYRWDPGALRTAGQVVAVALYAAVILLGALGPPSFRANRAPTVLTEMVWWVSYGIFAALVGNVWPAINPWRTVYRWAGAPTLGRAYPERLGVLPALLVFLAFAWLTIVGRAFALPRFVAAAALGYGALMWVGMGIYGETWLERVDAFTIVFGYFGRVAPLSFRDGRVAVRRYGAGLVDGRIRGWSEVALVVAVLFALTFDGFRESLAYAEVAGALPNPGLAPAAWAALSGFLLLAAGLVASLAAYLLVAALMWYVTGTDRPVGAVARRFVLSLVPIAAAYHVAHYSLYYFLQHELVLGTLANPLPGAAVEADPDLVSALAVEHVWFVLVALIVLGHVLSVRVAHRAALSFFETRKRAIKSGVPLTALMVAYTMVSLWIVSQPFAG